MASTKSNWRASSCSASASANPRDRNRQRGVFRMMTRAGFSSRIIFRILKTWDVDDETISALETEASG